MAILSVKEMANRAGGIDDEVERTYRREFVVITSSLADGPLQVRLAPGIPRIYDSYVGFAAGENDGLSFCKRVQVDSLNGEPFAFIVTCDYSSKLDDAQDQQNDNPLLRAADVEWSSASFERPLCKDNNGIDVQNSAGEAFDPPPTLEENRPVLMFTRNEQTFTPATAIAYEDAVNTDTFLGAPARQAKVKSISGRRLYENGVIFWSVKYEIHFRRDGFDYRFLDQGFRDVNGKLFRDPVDGTPYSSPTLMDGSGGRLTLAGPFSLGAAVDAVRTQITISTAGSPLPDPTLYDFSVVVDSEEIQILTSLSGGSYTVLRGANQTTATAHANATTCKLQPVYRRFRARKELAFAPLNISV